MGTKDIELYVRNIIDTYCEQGEKNRFRIIKIGDNLVSLMTTWIAIIVKTAKWHDEIKEVDSDLFIHNLREMPLYDAFSISDLYEKFPEMADGYKHDENKRRFLCPECQGTGYVTYTYDGRYTDGECESDCPLCYGYGKLSDKDVTILRKRGVYVDCINGLSVLFTNVILSENQLKAMLRILKDFGFNQFDFGCVDIHDSNIRSVTLNEDIYMVYMGRFNDGKAEINIDASLFPDWNNDEDDSE